MNRIKDGFHIIDPDCIPHSVEMDYTSATNYIKTSVHRLKILNEIQNGRYRIVDNKRAKMALIRSPQFKVVIVQIVCVVEIQSESAWALTNITSGNTCRAKFHASEASGSVEEDFNIFVCISLFKPRTPWGGSILDPGATI